MGRRLSGSAAVGEAAVAVEAGRMHRGGDWSRSLAVWRCVVWRLPEAMDQDRACELVTDSEWLGFDSTRRLALAGYVVRVCFDRVFGKLWCRFYIKAVAGFWQVFGSIAVAKFGV
ncbi:hypothetical protein RYX36_018072 [Vicia faba]